MPKPQLLDFVKYHPEVGTTYALVTGLPGSGKSNLASGLMLKALELGHCGLMRGTASCEWRHFVNFPSIVKKIKLLIPEKAQIHYKNFPKENYFETIVLDYEELDILKYLEARALVVVYDECFTLANKTWLMTDILRNAMYRTNELWDTAVTYLEHEAGVLYPMQALSPKGKIPLSDKHWYAVYAMCEIVVDFRKFLIQPIFVSQLDSEMHWAIANKCTWRILKQGKASTRVPFPVQKQAPMHRIDQYSIVIGEGKYRKTKTIDKFPETNEIWKMIPAKKKLKYKCELETMIDIMTTDKREEKLQEQRDNLIRYNFEEGKTQPLLAQITGLSQPQISRIVA